jgi:hypothetical protein
MVFKMKATFKKKRWSGKYGDFHETTAKIEFSEADLIELLRIAEADNGDWSKVLSKEIKEGFSNKK